MNKIELSRNKSELPIAKLSIFNPSLLNPSMLKKALAITLLVMGGALPQITLAQDNHERWYQVEMIIFARGESSKNQEAWPKNIKLAYPDNLNFLKPIGSNNAEGFNLLPVLERKLNSQAATIAKSGSYTLLFHQAWGQMIQAKNTHIFINGGKKFNDHHELEGNISLSVGQYLKFQSNLWLTQFAPIALDSATTMASTETDLSADATTEEPWPELPGLPNSETSTSEPADFVTKRIVKVFQQRSMRSTEVHYIDHPLLGIIVKISPLLETGQPAMN
ncbi:MAG: CsiV family protein [Pseudomonadota bacterium]